MNTKEAIVSQLCENTGSALCDSGGAYGRHHERNAGKAWEELAKSDEFGITSEFYTYSEPGTGRKVLAVDGTLQTAWYMDECLTFAPELDEQFRQFAEDEEDGVWSLENAEQFVISLGCRRNSRTFNTYNGESDLSQVLQGVEFDCPESYADRYVLLATHNGCDVRGGYSQYRCYRIDDDSGSWGIRTARNLVAEPYSWDSDGFSNNNLTSVHDMPCVEFKYFSKLEQNLKDLESTNKNDDETRSKMVAQDKLNREAAFEEFVEALEEDCFIVSEGKAWYFDGEIYYDLAVSQW